MKLFKAGLPFSIYPSVDFRKYISNDPNRIMKKAWAKTWRDLNNTITQVKKRSKKD